MQLFFDGYQNLTPSPSTLKELNPRPQVERGNTVCWWSTHWATIPLQNNKERHKHVFCAPPSVHHAHHGMSTFPSFNCEIGMRITPGSFSCCCALFISSLVLLPHRLESKFYFLVRPSLECWVFNIPFLFPHLYLFPIDFLPAFQLLLFSHCTCLLVTMFVVFDVMQTGGIAFRVCCQGSYSLSLSKTRSVTYECECHGKPLVVFPLCQIWQ